MSVTDWIVVSIGGIVGWGLVSLVARLVRQQKQPPMGMDGGVSRQTASPAADAPAETEIGGAWHEILSVPEQASAKEIEDAYHLRIAECDRIRFSPTESPEERTRAQIRRSRIHEAYEYIRPLRAV